VPASALLEGTDDDGIKIRARLVTLSVREQTDPTWRFEDSEHTLLALREEAARLADQTVIDRCELSYGRLHFFGGDTNTYRETALRLLHRRHDHLRESARGQRLLLAVMNAETPCWGGSALRSGAR